MTEPPGLPYRPEEWELLAHRWERLPEHEQESLRAQMTRAQWRRFERTIMQLDKEQRTYHGKLTTREDVVQINALFIERQVLPIAARLDAVERWIAYREMPWWKRLRVALLARWAALLLWLEAKGIRFYTLDTEGEHAGADRGDDGARGGEAGAAERAALEVPEGPPGDRLHAGREAPLAERDGAGASGAPESAEGPRLHIASR